MPVFKRVNKNFFKKWTPEMAYVLGFFAADGYMTINKRNAHFWNIQINDKELLNEIKKSIGSEHRISIKTRKRKGEKISYRLQIGSKEMFNDLYKLGMRQNKTKSLSILNVPNRCSCHFIRGYFDGDGHVWSGLIHKERKTQTLSIHTVFTSCSKRFLELIKDGLADCGIINGRLYKGNGNCWRLVYSIKNSLKLYDFMYNNIGPSKLFLKRKKDTFEKYFALKNAAVAQR